MDPLDHLAVRFHFNGEFINDGKELHYVGGTTAMSYIERDKVSIPEIVGHFKDHCTEVEGKLFHWLFPGEELKDGLAALLEDSMCQKMSDSIVECGVAEIYVEPPPVDLDSSSGDSDPGSDFEKEMGSEHEDTEGEEDVTCIEVIRTPSENGKAIIRVSPGKASQDAEVAALKKFYNSPKRKEITRKRKRKVADEAEDEEYSSEDDEYFPEDDCQSEEDEEAEEINQKFKEYKKKLTLGQVEYIDDVLLDDGPPLGSRAQVGEDNADNDNATPYEDSTEFEDSYDELAKMQTKYPRFKSKGDAPQFSLGMKFGGKDEFKQAIVKYGLHHKKLIRFKKNDARRVRATCDWSTCPWVCLLTRTTRTESWQITSFNDFHLCPPRKDNKLVTSTRIATKYERLIRANPMWNLLALKAHVQEEMFANVSVSQVKRAKYLVMQRWLDATKGQYSKIFEYQVELLRSNPGSTVVVKLEPDCAESIFQRIYVCLNACKQGFMDGCRKVVGLDGCFFKGATNGELLCAIGRDANNQMYPIAWAVVEKETNDSWDWFCALLFKDVKVLDGAGWVIISDQQKGIINAVHNWAPLAEHRNCARHIYANWRLKFKKKEWQQPFWRCAKAPCVSLFNLARAKLAQQTVEGARAVMNTDPRHWSRAWFKLGSNCDSVDNNICESFNKWIVEARFLPIISMLETIRRKVMVRIQEQRSKCERWTGQICPNINKKINTMISESGYCHAISNGNDSFEVKHHSHTFTVDLRNKTCSCRYWQLSGMPCAHAMASIHMKTNRVDDYVASCYSVMDFKKTYAHCLQPVNGMESWPESGRPKPGAPGYVKMPGRPRKERRREAHEKPKSTRVSKVGTIVRCRVCKCTGHNKTTCSQNPERIQTSEQGIGSSAPSATQPSAPSGTLVIAPIGCSAPSTTQQRAPSGTKVSASKGSSASAANVSKRNSKALVQASQESTNHGSVPSSRTKSTLNPDQPVSTTKSTTVAPQHKMKASSKASVKAVTVNVSSSSGFTVNVSSGAANSQVSRNGRARKRATKLPAKLLE